MRFTIGFSNNRNFTIFLKKVLPYDNRCEAPPAIYRIELFLNDMKENGGDSACYTI